MAILLEECPGLTGTFYQQGKRFRISLTANFLSWKLDGLRELGTSIPLNQLIAVHPCDCSTKKPKFTRCHHCTLRQYHLSPSLIEILPFHAKSVRFHFAVPHGKHSWKLKSQTFSPTESSTLKLWLCHLQQALLELNRPKKLLVFVNPFGGKKKGVQVYENKVSPLFHLAGIDAQVIITQRPNHAKEILKDLDLYKYDGVVGVGGDGIFSEVLNGILLKTQKEKGIDINDPYTNLVSPRIPFGIIPSGSTNAAAFGAMGTQDPISATLLIIMGDNVGLDVCAVHSVGSFVRFAVTFLSYGYFGDVILDSDKLRCLGPKRYEISGLKKLMNRKLYKGELRLKISTSLDQSTWELERCRSGCTVCTKAKEKCQNQNILTQSSTSERLKWITVQSRFMAISSAIMSCACKQAKDGISPSQHIGNGYCDVIVVAAKSRLDYLKYLLRTTYNYKNAFDLDFVQVYRVQEFMFSPYDVTDYTPDTSCASFRGTNWKSLRTSVWNCDGEVLKEPSVYSKVHCQLINVFGRGLEDRVAETASNCFGLCQKECTV